MITHVEALPKVAMIGIREKILTDLTDRAVISIIDPDAEVIFENNTHRILTCVFSDLEPTSFLKGDWFHGTKERYMDTKQAYDIVARIARLAKDEKEWRLLINCSAGICRSGAIAQFAQVFSTMKDSTFVSVNTQIRPNQWVLCKLIEVWKNEFPDLIRTCEYTADDYIF